jgi:HK97 family phage prohead protease
MASIDVAEVIWRAKYNTADRDKMAKAGAAMPDGSYPIADRDDLTNAIRAVGRGAGSHNAIRKHIMARAKALGLSSLIPDSWQADGSMADNDGNATRSAPVYFHRNFPLTDIQIQRAGDGRTVEAYAAVFHQEAEIRDHQGHYLEVIDPAAFNRAIGNARPGNGNNAWRVGVFYNHARDLYGNPSADFSKPIGVPVDIHPDGKGLVTVTRYSQTPLADEILELVRDGAIAGQSFTGQIQRSNPEGRNYTSRTGKLTTVKRMQLGLTEYGPTPMPAYEGAGILSVRNLQPAPSGDSGQEPHHQPDDDATDDSPLRRSAREVIRLNRALGVKPS